MDKEVLKSIQANAKCHIDYDGGRYITHAQTMYDMATELLAHMDNGLSPAEVAELLAIGNQGGKKVMAAEKEANALRERVRALEAENGKLCEDRDFWKGEYGDCRLACQASIELTGKAWQENAALTAERDGLKEWKRETREVAALLVRDFTACSGKAVFINQHMPRLRKMAGEVEK